MYADFSYLASEGKATRFTEEHARALMLQTRLRSIGIGDQSYTVSLRCSRCMPSVVGLWLRR
jgi:hypothetical protein